MILGIGLHTENSDNTEIRCNPHSVMYVKKASVTFDWFLKSIVKLELERCVSFQTGFQILSEMFAIFGGFRKMDSAFSMIQNYYTKHTSSCFHIMPFKWELHDLRQD